MVVAVRNPKSERKRMIVTDVQRDGAKMQIEAEFDGYPSRLNGEAIPPITTSQDFLRNSINTMESAMKSHTSNTLMERLS